MNRRRPTRPTAPLRARNAIPSLRRFLPFVACAAAAACAPRGAPSPTLATEDACAAAANAREAATDRDRLISSDQSLSPFSSSGLPDDPSAGLSARYARETAIDDCVSKRTSSTSGGVTVGPQGRE